MENFIEHKDVYAYNNIMFIIVDKNILYYIIILYHTLVLTSPRIVIRIVCCIRNPVTIDLKYYNVILYYI